jgi:peptidyl-prolyl cis-trans isomerase D
MLQRMRDSLGKWIVVAVLALIAFSFIFWGVDFGLTGAARFAARVNGEEVPLTDFERELQARQNQYQTIYRSDLPEDVRRELRRAVVNDLVRQTALAQRVEQQGYRASNERLTQSIREIAAFQVAGEFSLDVYRGQLANAGLTPTSFEALQRESLALTDLTNGVAESTFLTPAEFRRFIELYNQRREVGYALFELDAFTANVEIDDAAIAERYENNQASYQTTETVDLEYIELALADVAGTVQLSEEDLRAAYEEERERFEVAEERRARHILIEAADGEEDAARAAAESAAARVRGGEDFAAVAAEVSADAGTKAQGGDLGWIGRGMLPGPFEETLFALQAGDVSDPVRTEFGFHVIRLDEVRAGDLQPFEAVREELAAETRTRRAENEFYDLANQLGDAAFDAYEELASVAAATDLPLKTVAGFPRTGDNDVFTNSAAVVQAAFADEIVDSGRNSELVELDDDHVLVLRVTAHQLPAPKPLDEVREQIREELTRERASVLAEQAAQAFLTDLEQGGDAAERAEAHGGSWNAPMWVMRTDAALPTEVLSAAFGMPKGTAGVAQRELVALAGGGQAVVVLTGVEAGQPASLTQEERDQRQEQLAQQAARAEINNYAGNVSNAASVTIPEDILNPPLF